MSSTNASDAAAAAAAAAAALLAAEQVAIEDNFGSTFAGSFIAIFLLGFVVAQIYMYYTRYPRDPAWMKMFVCFIFVADTISCGFLVAWLYIVFIKNWGDPKIFLAGDWMSETDPFFLGLIAISNHFFFARRVFLMTDNLWIPAIICVCGLGAFGGGLAVMGIWAKFDLLYSMVPHERAAVLVCLASSAVGDLIITASISWWLYSKKSGFKRTDRLVDKIIRNTMQNGLLTAAVASIELILYLSMQESNYIAFSWILPRLHVNTILSSLNAREPHFTEERLSRQNNSLMFNSSVLQPDNRQIAQEVVVHVEAHELSDSVKTSQELSDGVKPFPSWEHAM